VHDSQHPRSHPTKINRDFVKHLFSLSFIQEKRNVAFVGVPGTGKSHLAIALGHHACINGYKVIFEPVYSMIEELSIAKEKGTFIKTMKKYTSAQLLIIDEIGFVPINQDDSNLFFQVISRRYEKGGIVITTNRAFKEWATIFNNDQIITSGMLDRLLHRCDPVHIEGLSYRMREIQN